MKAVCQEKLATANAVLATFNRSQIEPRPGGFYVCWEGRGGPMAKRWICRGGQDFYPMWSHQWPGGGTAITALSQLIRWLRGQPVLPIGTWHYWASEKLKLLPKEAIEQLRDGGYPERADCVLCGNEINGQLDWWNLDGVSGPCCGWTSGCRQKPTKIQ